MGHSANTAVFLNGKIYVGRGDQEYLQPLYQINAHNIDKNSRSSPINTQYYYFAMPSLNNSLIIAGGIDHRGDPTNQIFTLNNNLLKEYTKMKLSRGYASAVGDQGMLFIAGGRVYLEVFSSTELFDSKTGYWYVCENLPQPHYWLQSLVVNNAVYLLGGFDEDCNYSQSVFSARLDTLLSQKFEWNTLKPTP